MKGTRYLAGYCWEISKKELDSGTAEPPMWAAGQLTSLLPILILTCELLGWTRLS
jgi:hypothetical protein